MFKIDQHLYSHLKICKLRKNLISLKIFKRASKILQIDTTCEITETQILQAFSHVHCFASLWEHILMLSLRSID